MNIISDLFAKFSVSAGVNVVPILLFALPEPILHPFKVALHQWNQFCNHALVGATRPESALYEKKTNFGYN